jgi:hypothetical protein
VCMRMTAGRRGRERGGVSRCDTVVQCAGEREGGTPSEAGVCKGNRELSGIEGGAGVQGRGADLRNACFLLCVRENSLRAACD